MLKTNLSTSLKLETRIDPALILRSELVELPLLQLESRVKLALNENPFIEIEEKLEEVLETIEEKPEKEADLDWEDIVRDFSNYENTYPQIYDKGNDEKEYIQPVVKTLKDSLEEQIYGGDFFSNEIEIAKEIIGNLNDEGYLACPLYDIAKIFDNLTVEDVEVVLKKIQKIDPVGIGSRDLQECLLVQLEDKKLYIQDAYIVLRDYFNDFFNKRYEKIMKRTGIDKEQMKEIIDEILSLNPKPGSSQIIDKWDKGHNDVNGKDFIVPDFYVREVDGELKILLNDTSIPNLKINSGYGDMLLSGNVKPETKNFVKKKLESARWFINAIYQRQQTLLKVMTSIVKYQNDFFMQGPTKVKPLILKTVAEDIEMDIATISRCTKEKYVDTEFGIYELKFFFSEKLESQDGEEVSTTIIKQKLKELIDSEDKMKPLSDQKMSDILKKAGHIVARRTVQKYREQLMLPIARLRKEL